MKKIQSILLTAALLAVCCVLSVTPVRAEDGYELQMTDISSCYVGDSITVNISIKPEIAGVQMKLHYDYSALTYTGCGGGFGNLGITNYENAGNMILLDYHSTPGNMSTFYCSLYFTANTIGTAYITVTELIVTGDEGNEDINMDEYPSMFTVGSSTINIVAKPTYSSEARLSSLSFGSVSLSPSFSPDTYSYNITVPYTTGSLSCVATAMESHATVSVPDFTSLSYGTYTYVVSVTAQDGVTKASYSVSVTRQWPPETSASPTEGTTEEETEETTEEATVTYRSSAVLLQILDFPEDAEIPEGYVLAEAEDENGTVYARWEPEGVEEINHYILYGVNENGAEGYYLYDIAENTLQRYDFAILPTEESTEEETAEETTESEEETKAEETSEAETSAEETTEEESTAPGETSAEAETSSSEASGLLDRLGSSTEVPGWLLAALAAALLILLAACIALAISHGGRNEEFEEDELQPPEEETKAEETAEPGWHLSDSAGDSGQDTDSGK